MGIRENISSEKMKINSEELALMLSGVGAGTFIAFIFIPLSLWMDVTGSGKPINFFQMWESLGVVAIFLFVLSAILFRLKKRPEESRMNKWEIVAERLGWD